MKANFLLVGNHNRSTWFQVLSHALSDLGTLRVLPHREACNAVLPERFDLILVDATAVDDPMQLVVELLGRKAELRIIVVSVVPTWQEARAVLLAGAIDYITRPTDKDELLAAIQRALEAPRSGEEFSL